MGPRPGESFGRYDVDRQLGRGGMGVVFAARHRDLQREVALKVLAPDLSDDSSYRNRFLREAQALARLDSPHVVRIFDAGEHDGWLYIATEYVPDGDLGQLLRRRGSLAPPAAADLITQVGAGLAVAHETGILHRDLKPSNVLVRQTPDGAWRAQLCDFGIATVVDAEHTATIGVIGTPGYMAPERHEGQPATVASDVYSLGCLLWAALSGGAPYEGSAARVLIGHLQEPVPQLLGTTAVDLALNAVLRRAMAKQPAARYQDVGAMVAALREAVRAVAPPAVPEPASADTVLAPATRVLPAAPAPAPVQVPEAKVRSLGVDVGRKSRRWQGLVAAAAAVGVLVGITAWVAVASRTGPPVTDLEVVSNTNGHSEIDFEPPTGKKPESYVVTVEGRGEVGSGTEPPIKVEVPNAGGPVDAVVEAVYGDGDRGAPATVEGVDPWGPPARPKPGKVHRQGYAVVFDAFPGAKGEADHVTLEWARQGSRVSTKRPNQRACATVRTKATRDGVTQLSAPVRMCGRSLARKLRFLQVPCVEADGDPCLEHRIKAVGFRPNTTFPATIRWVSDGRQLDCGVCDVTTDSAGEIDAPLWWWEDFAGKLYLELGGLRATLEAGR